MGTFPSKYRQGSSPHAVPLDHAEFSEHLTMDRNKYVVVALYDYPAGCPADCSIRVGERLTILTDEGEWCRVRSSATGKESYIPSNYTAKLFHRWQFEGLSRQKAEELLMLPYNEPGSFLIRESQTHPGAHTLSVRKNSSDERRTVKHYRIYRLDNGWHYISPRLTFQTLFHLVEHYSEVEDGLCCLLREPCYIQGSNNVPVVSGPPPKAIRKPTLNWKDVNSSMIFGKTKEGAEDSLVSEGLKEAINSYLYMTEACGECSVNWDT
ncbi:src-like-adapter 2 [Chanos chanos]|uniref:Src-like-adapter 2 n=1 Tax=Chanos chanos TaxID=29144 RepID=A0A6J2V2J2_CHACN|nr:src-like-adapter 2 [Chanos chanos]